MFPGPLPPPALPPTPSEWVAPGPDTLATALDELERRLVVAEALALASARWQNERQPGNHRCDLPASPYLHVATHWRDAAQRARAQRDRVDWLWESPTLADIRTDELAQRHEALDVRARDAAKGWMVFRSWHQRYGPRCSELPPMVPLRPSGPIEIGVHAVWVMDGVLCAAPSAGTTSWAVEVEPIDSVGVFLVRGATCVASDTSCLCSPLQTRPGEVLTSD